MLQIKGKRLKKVNIEKGQVEAVNAIAEENIGITVPKGSEKSVKHEIIINKDIKLPLKKGKKIGTVIIMKDDIEKAEYNIVSDRNVERASFGTTYIRMIKKMI